jgi:hypothetical protein
MEKAKIEIIRKDLPTYFLTIHDFDLSEYVYTLSNSEEFPHKVSTQSHSSTMVVKPRYGKETISATYGDTLIWNDVSVGVISSSELLKMMEVEYERE